MILDKINIVIGVSGGISCYKIADLVSRLSKFENINIDVIMTRNATEFISPLTFQTLSKNRCIVDMFDYNYDYENVKHISIAKKADILLIAPATANVISKIANGIADDMLTTVVMASRCIKLIAPAMNNFMYENNIIKENISKLSNNKFEIIPPTSGLLACNENGIGKLASINTIYDIIIEKTNMCKDLIGKKILITAGPTVENIDPVRFISNNSSGKMGYSLAEQSFLRGADVTLISGPTNIQPKFIGIKQINTTSCDDMFNCILNIYKNFDIIIKAAAVSDYKVSNISKEKMKKDESNNIKYIELIENIDILKYLGENKQENQYICGFCMETENLIENAKIKFKKKNLDMIIANDLTKAGSGFKVDTNIGTIITKNDIIFCDKMKKTELAKIILDKIIFDITG
ncbi:MAG: bifunctional phosphopantothenoylcysteine decarboxylase/phosphopantothenate--cysteine ligase CoaBC [Oscillospiraceae bacterium]|nr:bifunctional phosphopantothenoylcysteine decarboxylase/phosphopantothenate--cysteine ligase CoaBC [Oscillospiraceae bacterium]